MKGKRKGVTVAFILSPEYDADLLKLLNSKRNKSDYIRMSLKKFFGLSDELDEVYSKNGGLEVQPISKPAKENSTNTFFEKQKELSSAVQATAMFCSPAMLSDD